MKIKVLLATMAFSSLASAYPSVKDKVTFNGVYAGGAGGHINYTQVMEITAFNAETKQYTVHAIVTVAGKDPGTQDSQLSVDEVPNTEKIKAILAHCVEAGGTPETLTVGAGTFQTCSAAQDRGGKIYLADVPFGIAKQVSIDEDGNINTLELASYSTAP